MTDFNTPDQPAAGDELHDDETIVIDLAETEDDIRQAEVMRLGLEDYELDEEDAAVLSGVRELTADEIPDAALPVLAVVGRPNVGKSTLVNRVLGRREAVVQDTPGVTRDRVRYRADWAGRPFILVDTGGWEHDARGLNARVADQAEVAVSLADAVIFVVDATVGPTATDEKVVQVLRRSGKPVLLVANKVDSPRDEADAATLWSLGLGEPYPVSALHGRGSGDMLDAAMLLLPEVSAVGGVPMGGPNRVALVGKPNVGKSSLLNSIIGHERVVVDDVAGTTRDPVDELVQINGKPWVLVDTAGIRRRVNQTQGADFYASLRTQAAIEKAEVAVVLIDASQTITEQDIRVIQEVIDAGRALVVAYNKWDLMDEDRRPFLEREIEQGLVQIPWAPRVNVSAKTRWHVDRIGKHLDSALDGWETRVPTGRLNAFLGELTAATPHPVRSGKQPRILFGTQADTRPPRFVLFATGFLEAGYRRFIERRLREEFGFVGTPIEISVRVREKRKR
ncbi:GTP-binding protein EngA [Serinibacter arcticus]|uniref:GTPase Der n=2 Tax=Serinibacter arcticus TaxID=1655435 RepID=A0A4Z1DYD2_9MICO|nr:GTP-binding protein EngA [Serinibacter arcticus]